MDEANKSRKTTKLSDLLTKVTPFLVIVSGLVFSFTQTIKMDSDHLWSIAVGRWIDMNRAVPYEDVHSWTVYGKEWVSNSWLFCWLMYYLDGTLGYLGVLLLIAAVYLVAGYFLFLLCKRFNPTTFSTLIFIIGMVLLVALSVMPRAYIFTLAFVAAIMYLLRFKWDSRLLYLIPLLMFFWSNIQRSFHFGMAILAVEALVATFFYKDRRLWPVVGLSFLAILVNPYGLYFGDISLAGFFTPGTQFIAEWGAPDFDNMGMLLLYLFFAATGVFAFNRLEKPYDRDKLMILFWFGAAFLYSLTTIRALTYVMLLWAPCFTAFSTRPERESRLLKPVVAMVVLSLFLSSTIAGLPQLFEDFKKAGGISASTVEFIELSTLLTEERVAMLHPLEAVEFLEENPRLQERLFNDYGYGGYLLLKEIPVFIDPRESVFTRHSVTEDYFKTTRLETRPEDIIEKYDIHTFLIRRGTSLAFYLEALVGWKKVYEDERSVIFIREGMV